VLVVPYCAATVPAGGVPEVIASAGVAVTAIALVVPVMEGVTVSVAVMVWLPGVSSVIWKFPDPVCTNALAGRMAVPSELEMWTVPL
jgi:hypothetical protein